MDFDALKQPLDRKNVKSRKQGGASVSYIEAWHAIAEANRIFGFDGWHRETVETVCVAEHQRKVGNGEGWGVTYRAKVRVRVYGDDPAFPVIREGCGAGHGIDRDLGQAHESAIKEAESDAMKRALMTFGNPFGLALYDKEQREVGTPEPTAEQRVEMAKGWASDMTSKINGSDNLAALNGWMERNAASVEKAEAAWPGARKMLEGAINARVAALHQQMEAVE